MKACWFGVAVKEWCSFWNRAVFDCAFHFYFAAVKSKPYLKLCFSTTLYKVQMVYKWYTHCKVPLRHRMSIPLSKFKQYDDQYFHETLRNVIPFHFMKWHFPLMHDGTQLWTDNCFWWVFCIYLLLFNDYFLAVFFRW